MLGMAGASKKELVKSNGAVFNESGDGAVDRVCQTAPVGVHLIVGLVAVSRCGTSPRCPGTR